MGFVADDNGAIVELEHRNLDRFGAATEEMRKLLDSPGSWMGLLENFAKEAV